MPTCHINPSFEAGAAAQTASQDLFMIQAYNCVKRGLCVRDRGFVNSKISPLLYFISPGQDAAHFFR
jgi:hypothetical protein